MKEETKFWYLQGFNLFKKMGHKNIMAISSLLEMQTHKRGSVLSSIQNNKDIIYLIKSGTLKIESVENNHTLEILKSGDIFGELNNRHMAETTRNEQAIALEDCIVCIVEADQLKSMMEKYETLKNQMLKFQGLKIRKLQNRLADLVHKNSETRIKEYIVSYLEQYGKKKDNLLTVKNILSHKDIGHLTNTSRQTVSNVMSTLRKNGIIDYNAKEIRLK